MFAPPDCPRPPKGQLVCWSRTNFAGGSWQVVDHMGRIITSGTLFSAVHDSRSPRTLEHAEWLEELDRRSRDVLPSDS